MLQAPKCNTVSPQTAPKRNILVVVGAILWAAVLLFGAGALAVRVLNAVDASNISGSAGKAASPLIDTDLLAILPHYHDATLRKTLAVIDEQRNRRLLLAVSFPLASKATATAPSAPLPAPTVLLDNLSQQLEDSGLFALPDVAEQVRHNSDLSTALWNYRHQLLSQSDAQRLQHRGAGEAAVVETAMAQLYGFGTADERLLRDDPLFLFQRYLQTTSPINWQQFDLHGNWLSKIHQQRHYYLLPLTLNGSAFDSDYQQAVKQVLGGVKSQVSAEHGELLAVGAVVFAEQGFSQSKNEMSTVGLGGLLGIVVLLLVVFRSALPLLWLLSALTMSLTLALSVALWWFGSLHIFALLFSAAIVGISADYGFHFFTDAYLHQDRRTATVRRIFSGLTLGMLSSVLAYALFAWGGFAVLSQVAVLALVGLPAMYLTVVLLLPFAPLPKRLKPLPRRLQRLAAWLVGNRLTRTVAVFLQRPLVVLSVTAAMGGAVFFIPPNDDVRALQSLSPQALADEQLLRTLFERPYVSDYAVLVGANLDDLLATEANWLQTAPDNFIAAPALSDLLPDRQRQRVNYAAYQRLYASDAVKAYAEALGGLPNVNLPAFQTMNAAEIARLPAVKQRFAERLVELPVDDLFTDDFSADDLPADDLPADDWFVDKVSGGQWALLLPMPAGDNAEAISRLRTIAADSVRVEGLNPTADMSAQFGRYRVSLSRWVAVAVGALLLLGVWRYGRRGVAVALLPLLSALSAVAITSLVGLNVSLFSVLAVLLLLGMGLDYVIFLAESQKPDNVMLSLCLSCATTMLSFGLLAFSQTAAVATFGLTVAVGMALIVLLSPMVVSRLDSTVASTL